MAHRAKHLTEEKKLIAKTQAKNKALNAGGHGDKFGPPWKSEKLKNKEVPLFATGLGSQLATKAKGAFSSGISFGIPGNQSFADASNSLANNKFQYLQFYLELFDKSRSFHSFHTNNRSNNYDGFVISLLRSFWSSRYKSYYQLSF